MEIMKCVQTKKIGCQFFINISEEPMLQNLKQQFRFSEVGLCGKVMIVIIFPVADGFLKGRLFGEMQFNTDKTEKLTMKVPP